MAAVSHSGRKAGWFSHALLKNRTSIDLLRRELAAVDKAKLYNCLV